MKQLVGLDWDALAPAHGSVVETGAKQQFVAALAERGFTV